MEKPELVVVTKTYYDYNQCVTWLVEKGKITEAQKRESWYQVVERYIHDGDIRTIFRPSFELMCSIPSPDDDGFDDDYLNWVFELIWEEFGITDDAHDFIFKR